MGIEQEREEKSIKEEQRLLRIEQNKSNVVVKRPSKEQVALEKKKKDREFAYGFHKPNLIQEQLTK